jgi:formyltetrahydrofolate deformylase
MRASSRLLLRISQKATLRVNGPDQKGIVASVSRILDSQGCSIAKSEQWTDQVDRLFFQRIEFDHDLSNPRKQDLEEQLEKSCQSLSLGHALNWREKRPRVAIFVSKFDHCLWELLLRHEAKELECDIVTVISNHSALKSVADTFGIPFQTFPITPETRSTQEGLEIELLHSLDVDLIVLARYMQVLSQSFLNEFPNRIINIHHSFLPAFMGGSPYYQAHKRGVKLIGATAHYVTEDLDDGPIIEQAVMPVTHRDTPSDLRRKGRIIERDVLVHALQAHLDDRVITYNNKCVVFGD